MRFPATCEQDDSYGRSVQTVNNENRIKHLKKEIEDLKKKVSVHTTELISSTAAKC